MCLHETTTTDAARRHIQRTVGIANTESMDVTGSSRAHVFCHLSDANEWQKYWARTLRTSFRRTIRAHHQQQKIGHRQKMVPTTTPEHVGHANVSSDTVTNHCAGLQTVKLPDAVRATAGMLL